MVRGFFVAVAFAASVFAQEVTIPVLTVCEALADLKQYDDKTVIIVGRFRHTDEGSWLSEDCGLKIRKGDVDFDPLVSTSYIMSEFPPPPSFPAGYEWPEEALNLRLVQVMKSTKLRTSDGDTWGAVYGRLKTQLPPGCREDTRCYPGFGHLGGAPVQLISPERSLYALKPR